MSECGMSSISELAAIAEKMEWNWNLMESNWRLNGNERAKEEWHGE